MIEEWSECIVVSLIEASLSVRLGLWYGNMLSEEVVKDLDGRNVPI